MSVIVVTVTEAVELLLPASGSVVPAGAATDAELTSDPVVDGGIGPDATNVARPPAFRSTVVASAPVPDAALHVDPLVAVHDHVTPAASGNASVTGTPAASLGPLLMATMVHVSMVPAATEGA